MIMTTGDRVVHVLLDDDRLPLAENDGVVSDSEHFANPEAKPGGCVVGVAWIAQDCQNLLVFEPGDERISLLSIAEKIFLNVLELCQGWESWI